MAYKGEVKCNACCGAIKLCDWFRCNNCENRDYCRSCLIKESFSHSKSHTFTPMSVFQSLSYDLIEAECLAVEKKSVSKKHLLAVNLNFRQKQLQRSVCDGCGKKLVLSDCYRCNKCCDYDLCRSCFNSTSLSHPSDHTFSPMNVFREIGFRFALHQCLLEAKKKEQEDCAMRLTIEATMETVSLKVTHVCDQCNKKSLTPADWYRCNDCRDFDLCAKCFKDSSLTHSTYHKFTPMGVFQQARAAISEWYVKTEENRTEGNKIRTEENKIRTEENKIPNRKEKFLNVLFNGETCECCHTRHQTMPELLNCVFKIQRL